MSFLISSVRRQLIAAFAAVSLAFMIAVVLGWTGSSRTLMLVIALVAVLIACVVSFTISRDLSSRINELLDGITSLDSHCLADLNNALGAMNSGQHAEPR